MTDWTAWFGRAAWGALAVSAFGCVQAQALYVPSVYKASFGDGFKAEKHKTGYYSAYTDADNYNGVEYARHHFGIGAWSSSGEQVAYVTKHTSTDGTVKNLTVGYNTLDASRPLWTVDGTYAQRWSDQTTSEFTVNRDRVEVQPSLVNHVLASQYNVSIEHKVAHPVSVQFGVGETRYTDGNHRPLAKFKATYDVLPVQGLSLQLRSRYFKNTDTAVSSGYFNPYRFVENLGVVELNRQVADWSLSASLGQGRQAGGDDAKTRAQMVEFSATSPITRRVFVRAKAGYFRSLGYNGPDFIYRYVSEDVIVTF